MSTPATVWLVVGLLTSVAVAALLVALVRHVLVLGRAVRRFADEVTPIANEISAQGDRAASRSRRGGRGRSFGPAGDRAVR